MARSDRPLPESPRSFARNERRKLGLSGAYQGVHTTRKPRSILQRARRQHLKSVAVAERVGSLEIEAESYDADRVGAPAIPRSYLRRMT